MGSYRSRRDPWKRLLASFQIVICILFWFQTSFAQADLEDGGSAEPVGGGAQVLEEIAALIPKGEYEEAIKLCRTVIAEFSASEAVLREAFNYLVFLPRFLGGSSEESAREALTRFPDLVAGEDKFPNEMNRVYNDLRREMYGSLVVNVVPDSSLVFLDGGFLGRAPQNIPYLTVGSHFIEISHEDFEARADSISIDPGEQHVMSITLERQGGGFPWLIAAAGAVVGVVAAVVSGGSDSPPTEEPLPGPPDPPGK